MVHCKCTSILSTVWPEILAGIKFGCWVPAIANVLVVQYGIAIRIYVSKKFWRILIWRLLRQSANPPNLIPHQISGYTVYNKATIVFVGHRLATKAFIGKLPAIRGIIR